MVNPVVHRHQSKCEIQILLKEEFSPSKWIKGKLGGPWTLFGKWQAKLDVACFTLTKLFLRKPIGKKRAQAHAKICTVITRTRPLRWHYKVGFGFIDNYTYHPVVAWVFFVEGTFSRKTRPTWLVSVARQSNRVSFVAIGSVSWEEFDYQVKNYFY